MRLVAGKESEPLAEMQGDGSIYGLKNGSRKFFGRVSNDALLDAHDVPSLTCIHREVSLPAAEAKGRYDEHDVYADDRTRIQIADDGTVTLNGASGNVRIEGPIQKTRRTAMLLVIAAFQ